MLYEVEGDKRFREIREKIESDEKEGRKSDMCEYLDALEARGVEKGIEQGIEKGRLEGEKKFIVRMYNKGFTVEEIAETADKDVDEVKQIIFDLY